MSAPTPSSNEPAPTTAPAASGLVTSGVESKRPAVSPRRVSFAERVRGFARGLMSLDDTPHNIAMGVAIGTFVAYQPIVGIQMVIGAIICRLVGANVVASLPMAWITNPLTIVPIYYGTYRLGVVFVGGEKTYEEIKGVFSAVGELGFWAGLVEGYRLLVDVAWPLLVGGTVVGALNGVGFYFLTRSYLRRNRSQRAEVLALEATRERAASGVDADPSASDADHE